MPARKRTFVTPTELRRRVRNLNVLHNVDDGYPAYLSLEYRDHRWRVMILMTSGRAELVPWGAIKEVNRKLGVVSWGYVLKRARAESRYPARRQG